ncbi:MAG: hypothetical protein ABI920_14100 [Casimicrobiaceae bacterium]
MDAIRIAFSLALPWAFGAALLTALPRRKLADGPAGDAAWILGVGYLLGAFGLTLWMRLLSSAGLRFGVANVAIPVLVLAAGLAAFAWHKAGRPRRSALAMRVRTTIVPRFDAATTRVVWWSLVTWMMLRFVLLAVEVTLRPLYPWDAWIQWATKARVWFELRTLAPFGASTAWFGAPGSVYFDASPYYPPTIPLLQVWTSLALGRWDDALMNWPWWQILLALVLLVYGGLRSLDAGRLTALAGAFMVATLPLVDTHVALAGYADLPMAAFYTAAAVAVLRWARSRSRIDAGLALVLALACTQVKNPGLPWALTLVPAVIVTLVPRNGARTVAYLFGGALLLVAILAQTHPVVLHYRLHLDFDPAWSALARSYFLLGNWHLLWYGVLAAAVLARRDLLESQLIALTVTIAAGMLFLFIVFGFTNARDWVADQTSINRATLHFAPLAVVFGVLAFQAFAHRWDVRFAEPHAPQSEAADRAAPAVPDAPPS